MTVPARYQAWLVDLDGTLYHGRPLRLLMALELGLLGLRAASALHVFRRHHEELRSEGFSGPPTPYEEQLRRAAEELGYPVEKLEALVKEWMLERPLRWLNLLRRRGLLDELREAHAGGVKLGLVSDYPATGKLYALGVAGLFDVVVANGEPQGPMRLKPDPAGYLAAAAELGVAPEHCLVLGDREDADGRAAAAAGMGFRLIR